MVTMRIVFNSLNLARTFLENTSSSYISIKHRVIFTHFQNSIKTAVKNKQESIQKDQEHVNEWQQIKTIDKISKDKKQKGRW